jgi:hypothetical protein
MSKELLFRPLQLGAILIPNRIIMAPLTRMRAGANSVPTPMNAKYYAQRASAGLIISEGTAVSPEAHGYRSDPGIYTVEQIAVCASSQMLFTHAAAGSSCKSLTTKETRTLRCSQMAPCPLPQEGTTPTLGQLPQISPSPRRTSPLLAHPPCNSTSTNPHPALLSSGPKRTSAKLMPTYPSVRCGLYDDYGGEYRGGVAGHQQLLTYNPATSKWYPQ